MFGGTLYELPKEFMTELSSHIPDPCTKLFNNHWLCGQEWQIMQPESDSKPRSPIFLSWDCSVMRHHPRAAMQGLLSFRGTTLCELMTTVTPKNVHKHWVEFGIQSLWASVFVFSKCGIFRFFCFPPQLIAQSSDSVFSVWETAFAHTYSCEDSFIQYLNVGRNTSCWAPLRCAALIWT